MDEQPVVPAGVRSTEFLFAVLVVVCATVLLAMDKVNEESWKWAVTTVGGAYILGRSFVKGTANNTAGRVAEFKSDLATLAAAQAMPAAPTTVTNVAVIPDQQGEQGEQGGAPKRRR